MSTSLKDLVLQRRSRPSLVVNLQVSSTQTATAHHFAVPTPEPFRITPYLLTADGLPVLNGVLGALSCELVSCIPLHELCEKVTMNTEGVILELFESFLESYAWRWKELWHLVAVLYLSYTLIYNTLHPVPFDRYKVRV